MKVLAIDAGAYSVKFLEVSLDRKSLKVLDFTEVVIDDVKDQLPVDLSTEELAQEVIKGVLAERKTDIKVVLQLPNSMVTSRYITLPVNNKKKAEMMVPFQLEDNLPLPVTALHFALDFQKKAGGGRATVHIAPLAEFEKYHDLLEAREIMPDVLTTELGVMERWGPMFKASRAPAKGPDGTPQVAGLSYAILDIGHHSTKAYFFENDEVVANHVSYVAGNAITESIASTYNVPAPEAAEYKHKNAFFLTEGQYAEVGPDQAEFARLMQRTVWPLVQDVRRWDLGHRVRFGRPVDTIFVMGGGSMVRNFTNYLSQAIGLPVRSLTGIGPLRDKDPLLSTREAGIATLAQLMAMAMDQRPGPVNMLSGGFSKNFSAGIPLHSTAFLGWRVAAVSALLFVGMIIERQFLGHQRTLLETQLTKTLKSPALGLSTRDQRKLKTAPQDVLAQIKKKGSTVEQEIKTIMSQSKINAMAPLTSLSKALFSNLNVDLDSFSYDGDKVRGAFSAKNAEEMGLLKTKLDGMGLTGAKFVPRPGGDAGRPGLAFEYDWP